MIPKRKKLKTVNKLSQFKRTKKCPYCGVVCCLEFEVSDPTCAVKEHRICEHLTDYDKFWFIFTRDGWDD